MPKGPKITDDVVRLIATVYWDHREWRAKEIQIEVNHQLRKKRPDLNPNWPGLSAVQKELTKIRKRDAEKPQELDSDWSLGTLTKYDLPPDAIPTIIAIQEMRQNNGERPLTIREAWWVSRLRCLVSSPKVLSIAEVLSLWAINYAGEEEIAEISNTEFDTSELDQTIIAYAEEYVAYPFLFEWIQNNDGIDEAGSILNLALKLRCEARRRELFDEEKKFIDDLAKEEDDIVAYEGVNLAMKSSPQRLSENYEAKVKLFVDKMFEREAQNER